MKNKNGKINWDDVLEDFRGRGTIHAQRVEKLPNGKWRLHYRDGKKNEHIDWNSKRELDEALIEFGGKNTDTVAAPEKFLGIGKWKSEDLFDLGHRPTKISVRGFKTVRNTATKVYLPDDCGQPELMNAQRSKTEPDHIRRNLIDRETVDLTRCFSRPEEMDKLIDFLTSDEQLASMEWAVHKLCTEAIDEKKACVWKRTTAGDGTKRMILQLEKLNGKHYFECVHGDLLAAADGMADTECRSVPDIRKKPKDQMICQFSAKARGL